MKFQPSRESLRNPEPSKKAQDIATAGVIASNAVLSIADLFDKDSGEDVVVAPPPVVVEEPASPWPWIIGGGLALVLVGGGAYYYFSGAKNVSAEV